MDNLFQLIGISEATTFAITATDMDLALTLLPSKFEGAAKFLHSFLVQVTSGKAFLIVRLCADGNGLMAWRRLIQEYEPKAAMRWTAMLSALLTPKWAEDGNFSLQWLEWERKD